MPSVEAERNPGGHNFAFLARRTVFSSHTQDPLACILPRDALFAFPL
jgi:hypothetical protein